MSAKIFLRRLTDMSTFTSLQEKLARLNATLMVSAHIPHHSRRQRERERVDLVEFLRCERLSLH